MVPFSATGNLQLANQLVVCVGEALAPVVQRDSYSSSSQLCDSADLRPRYDFLRLWLSGISHVEPKTPVWLYKAINVSNTNSRAAFQ